MDEILIICYIICMIVTYFGSVVGYFLLLKEKGLSIEIDSVIIKALVSLLCYSVVWPLFLLIISGISIVLMINKKIVPIKE